MTYLPQHPTRSLAVPLAALALGIAGGTSAALILADSDTIIRGSAPAVEVRALPTGGTPVPERVAPAPAVAPVVSQSGPAPERVSPGPVSLSPRRAPTSSLAGTTASSAPVPERISGARTR